MPNYWNSGYRLQTKRKKLTKLCYHCNKAFIGIKTKQYCSDACYMAEYRARRKLADNQGAIPGDGLQPPGAGVP